jgi:hypothetical protein
MLLVDDVCFCCWRCDARVMWLRVCCLLCAMAVVWRRRCYDDDGVVELSVLCMLCGRCVVRDDDDGNDGAMADDRP